MMIADTRNLPEWFDLDNYSQFNNMSDKDLFYQLVVRYDMLKNYYQYGWDFDNDTKDNDSLIMNDEVRKILGNGIISDAMSRATYFYDMFKLPIERDDVLSGGVPLKPMSIEDFISMMEPVDKYMKDNFNGSPESLVHHSFTSINSILETNNIFIKADLSRPDDLLIDIFKRNLRSWRDSLKIQGSEKTYQSWETIKKRIFDYSLFPIVDLIIWSKTRRVTITNGVLAVAVFPRGGYDSIQIQQTIKPNIEKIFSISSIEKIRAEFKDRKILP